MSDDKYAGCEPEWARRALSDMERDLTAARTRVAELEAALSSADWQLRLQSRDTAMRDLAAARLRIGELEAQAADERDALEAAVRSWNKADAEVAVLRERLGEARGALETIAEYDTDFAKGPADNVAALQTVAERALARLDASPQAAPPVCQCDKHDNPCQRRADCLVTRAGKRIAVCDKCTLPGDDADNREFNPDWSKFAATPVQAAPPGDVVDATPDCGESAPDADERGHRPHCRQYRGPVQRKPTEVVGWLTAVGPCTIPQATPVQGAPPALMCSQHPDRVCLGSPQGGLCVYACAIDNRAPADGPTCAAGCGGINPAANVVLEASDYMWCSPACRSAGRPLRPAPAVPEPREENLGLAPSHAASPLPTEEKKT